MKLQTLIEAVLPTLVDELEGYATYELTLVALSPSGETAAQSLVNIRNNSGDYTVISSEVQILESP